MMSSFINTKYYNGGGVTDYIVRKTQAFTRLKELEEHIAYEFIVHQVLNQLPTSYG